MENGNRRRHNVKSSKRIWRIILKLGIGAGEGEATGDKGDTQADSRL